MLRRIEKYGLSLIRFTEGDIETVRVWRNSPYVRTKMIFQEEITRDMQEAWFSTVNNSENFYFIVEYNNEQVGVANIKNIDNGKAEPGFYLVNEKYEDTEIAALVSVALGDFGFNSLDIHTFYIHVLKNNSKALKYNLFLGYDIIAEKSTSKIAYMELTREIYNKKIKRIKSYLISK